MVMRAGRTSPGCLLLALLLAAAGYFGVNVGEAYWRYYKMRDAMSASAHFAASLSDRDIVVRLEALADSLHLPDEAYDNLVVDRARTGRSIRIETRYAERIELPGFVKVFRFAPAAEASF